MFTFENSTYVSKIVYKIYYTVSLSRFYEGSPGHRTICVSYNSAYRRDVGKARRELRNRDSTTRAARNTQFIARSATCLPFVSRALPEIPHDAVI